MINWIEEEFLVQEKLKKKNQLQLNQNFKAHQHQGCTIIPFAKNFDY